MSETGNFRSRLFGGFDRQDVSDYITVLAAERNELKERCARLEAEAQELRMRTEAAENMAAEEKRRADEFVMHARTEASDMLHELCEKYESARSDMEVTTAHVRGELERAANGLSLLMTVFSKAGESFDELRVIVDNGGDFVPDSEEIPSEIDDEAEMDECAAEGI